MSFCEAVGERESDLDYQEETFHLNLDIAWSRDTSDFWWNPLSLLSLYCLKFL
jgi:hypothetical protein